ncbi:MAG TPA: TspO/MBR family protein [Acidobacteriaceae bacterium]|jgi:tryptophan-rich sensory protein|nr:TspO/MBR family protein [Acidobacteriaceae bacterium]
MKNSRSWISLVGFGAAVAAAGWFGSRYSPRDTRTKIWYSRLDKSPLTPPNYVFPIVWTALYALMAIGGWRVWTQPSSPDRSRALRLWASQLASNAEWTRLFFGQHRPKQALIDVVALEAQIVGFIQSAREVDPAAAVCFLPYAAWVAFATLLNAEIVRRNPDAERLLPRAA